MVLHLQEKKTGQGFIYDEMTDGWRAGLIYL